MNTQVLQKLTVQKRNTANLVTNAVFDTHSISANKINLLRESIRKARVAVEQTTQMCMACGQLLNEVKESLGHGEFLPWVEKFLPEISPDTAERWRRAAANILRALPCGVIDIPVSDILVTPEEELPAEARKYRQAWFDFTADKTINECLAGVCVEGDPGHRVDRAINGKLRGGTRGEDRKDWPLFCAVKFLDLSNHFSHWSKMNATQKSELGQVIRGAILGADVSLTRGKHTRGFDFAGTRRKRALWPRELCELALQALKERMKIQEEGE